MTDAALAVFAQLYDEQGTPPRRARLPALMRVRCRACWTSWPPTRTALLIWGMIILPHEMWHETMHRKTALSTGVPLATTASSPTPATGCCPARTSFWPTPLTKPRVGYALPTGITTRSTLRPSLTTTCRAPTTTRMADRAEYLRRTPRVSWVEPGETRSLKPVTEYFRHVQSRDDQSSSERTLTITADAARRWAC